MRARSIVIRLFHRGVGLVDGLGQDGSPEVVAFKDLTELGAARLLPIVHRLCDAREFARRMHPHGRVLSFVLLNQPVLRQTLLCGRGQLVVVLVLHGGFLAHDLFKLEASAYFVSIDHLYLLPLEHRFKLLLMLSLQFHDLHFFLEVGPCCRV